MARLPAIDAAPLPISVVAPKRVRARKQRKPLIELLRPLLERVPPRRRRLVLDQLRYELMLEQKAEQQIAAVERDAEERE